MVISGLSLEGEQLRAQQQARLTAPLAVAEREASRTRFEGLGSAQAAAIARQSFPAAVNRPAGGLPPLAAGERITGYPTDRTATLDLPNGRHGVLESTLPIARETASGQRAPLDLGLSQVGTAFQPQRPLVPVRIPKRLSDGVAFTRTGVALTPVDAHGSPLMGAEGAVDGAGVLYANTQTDTDALVKPTTAGFEADTLLRSVQSPTQLFFRVDLPGGASLTQTDGSAEVRVLDHGQVIATVAAPSAMDAVGRSVPVAMRVSGDVLTVDVASREGFTYPIMVDPTVTEGRLTIWYPSYETESSHWKAETNNSSAFMFEESFYDLTDIDTNSAEYKREQWGGMAYETQGVSHIYGFTSESSASNAGSNIENKLFIISSGKSIEREVVMPSTYATTKEELCVESGCATGKLESGNEGNAAEFKQTAENTGNKFWSALSSISVKIVQESPPTVSVNTTSETIGGNPNFFHTGTWAGPGATSEVTGKDTGLGISELRLKSPNKPEWSERSLYTKLPTCQGVQCHSQETNTWLSAWGLPNGEDTVEATAVDPAGLTGTVTKKVKVDFSLPYGITLTGLPANKEIGGGQVTLKASSKDGTTIESSGIKSLELIADGKSLWQASGSCTPGPCTATGEWTISGNELPAGQHTLSVRAISYAGDVAEGERYTVNTGHLATPVAVGPGSVSPETGEFFLHATDVAVGGPGAALTVKRSFSSSHLGAGVEGPLGPQWSMSVGGAQSLTKAAEGQVVLTDASGQQSVFTSKGKGEFTSPPNAASLKLTEVTEAEKTKEFILTSAGGQVTKFNLPSGGTGSTWVPAALEGPDATDIVTYKFQTASGITEPTEVLAPVPTGVSCTSELVKGCRALGFAYSTKTTATGDGTSEWGEYNGRLKEVTFTAWEPTAGKMQTTAVAKYVYDKEGKLRGVWNPTVSPTLETTYGYDEAGRVSALTPPGEQPWLFNYGTATGDPRARLLFVARPPASTASGNGLAPVNTVAPALSSAQEPRAGLQISVSEGTWSNSPLSYSYQWESCSSGHCTPIQGATNATFTPTEEDLSPYRATVTATNANGSVTKVSEETKPLQLLGVSFKVAAQFASEGTLGGQVKEPQAIAVESASTSEENVWVADTGNNRIEKFKPTGTFVAAYGEKGTENGKFEKPVGIALNESDKYVYVSDAGNKRIQVFEASNGKYVSQVNLDPFKLGYTPVGIAAGKLAISGEKKNVLCVAMSTNEVWCYKINGSELVSGSMHFGKAGTGNGEFKEPSGVTVSENGKTNGEGNQIFVTDKGNHRVEIFEPELVGETIKYKSQFGSQGSGEGQFSSPGSIAIGPREGTYAALKNEVFVADAGNSRVQQTTQAGANPFEWKFGQANGGTGAQSLAFSEKSGEGLQTLYVLSPSSPLKQAGRVEKLVPKPIQINAPEVPNTHGDAVTTIVYHIAVSGASAPVKMGKTEVEAWGQKDDPVDATAVFPPATPMGWPPKYYYANMTTYYLDAQERTVNVKLAGGGVTTTEYNSKNDVERTLSADNRQTALNAGSKSAEVAKELDTENTYNAEGTELQSTLGPEHTVKLANGTQVQARNHKQYHYDEGAPAEGGPYGVPTKITEGAQFSGKEEDVRETVMYYSGQENLGWKLHEPTSVTTDPNGLKLTHTTVYDSSTGHVLETRQPASVAEPVSFAGKFGAVGAGETQFKEPRDAAVAPNGNVFVADTNNSRIEVYSATGEHISQFGSAGTGNGQFKTPYGIAVDAHGHVWVADTGNHRVQEFEENGKYVSQFGTEGAGEGQFKEPKGIAVDSKSNVYVSDAANNRVLVFGEEGKKQILAFGTVGTGEGQLKSPKGLVVGTNGNIYVADTSNNRIEIFNSEGKYTGQFGTKGAGNGQFSEPKGVALDASGDVYVSDSLNNRVQIFTPQNAYLGQFGKKGTGVNEFEEPFGISVGSNGYVYVADLKNNRIQWYTPGDPHDSQVIYYSAAANPSYPGCGEHPEWANLPCASQPAKQPEANGAGGHLPVVATIYNMWDEPEKTVETVGSTTRTNTLTYDAGGRTKTSTVSSSVGTALPTVSLEYNEKTGALEKQSTTSEGKTKTITVVGNTLGEVTSYTDASENTSTYEYNVAGDVSKLNDGKGTQTFLYGSNGLVEDIEDSAAGNFSAYYGQEDELLEEMYPNYLKAKYAYNQTGAATSLEYIKATSCSEKCTWFTDSVVPSIHGQWLEQTSTLSHEAYSYDAAGRLTQTQSTPAGKGCVTRVYAYDEDSNRTNLTTREPNVNGECASEGGTVETHSYDNADRLLDAGTTYNAFGDVTALPAAEAGGTELTSSYYVDNQVASQTQNGQTIGYNLDPADRATEVVSTGKVVATETLHYAGGGDTPTWTSEPSGKTTRNISAMTGLVAIQHGTETPILQLSNLHGDIVATAADSESAKELSSTIAEASEYGVPATAMPPKYSWLGAHELPTELPSGVIGMGARSYVPQIGRFLQPDPMPGGSVNAYAYTFADPVNSSDPSGAFTYGFSAWLKEANDQQAQEVAAREVARETLEREEAERRAAEAQEAAEGAAGPQYGGEEEESEEEEGEEFEYAAYRQTGSSDRERHGSLESLVLYQPIGENKQEDEKGGENSNGNARVPLCGTGKAGSPCSNFARGKKRRRKPKSAYNACEGRFNPSVRSEGCCVDGEVTGVGVPGKPTPGGSPCDVGREDPQESEYEKCPIDSERRYGPGGYYCKSLG